MATIIWKKCVHVWVYVSLKQVLRLAVSNKSTLLQVISYCWTAVSDFMDKWWPSLLTYIHVCITAFQWFINFSTVEQRNHINKLGAVGPRRAPCWPHEPCYQGMYVGTHLTTLHLCNEACRQLASLTRDVDLSKPVHTWIPESVDIFKCTILAAYQMPVLFWLELSCRYV